MNKNCFTDIAVKQGKYYKLKSSYREASSGKDPIESGIGPQKLQPTSILQWKETRKVNIRTDTRQEI